MSRKFFQRFTSRRLDLQAKISLLLVLIVLPTFVIVTIAQNKLTQPILEDELRAIGMTSAKTLSAEILGSKLYMLPKPETAIEARMSELLAIQPSIVRMDVALADPMSGVLKNVASNIEEDPLSPQPVPPAVEAVTTVRKKDDAGVEIWDILFPIEQRTQNFHPPRLPRRLFGVIHVVVSVQFVQHIVSTLWRTTVTAALFSVVALLVMLSYFLRKAITNDRKLRQAETQNLALTAQLHEAQRNLMNTEKLAVMGQLTASFAHEIGTPLNAIGGHLQLLKEETPGIERIDVISSQVAKIEKIVKSFLQSTAKPDSQRQLVDLNRIADRTLGIVQPRVDTIGVEVRREFDRSIGPLRLVPLDVEQILLNLINNSLDSLNAKGAARDSRGKLVLEVATGAVNREGKQWAEVSVYDTGEGIQKVDLKNVLKPFFTTKRPGEGTGLGLTICQELARKYGGHLDIDSKEDAWTRVTLRIPYQVNA
jgi:signal transduction histidine kinase